MEHIPQEPKNATPEAFEAYCRENWIGTAEDGGTTFVTLEAADAALALLQEAGFQVTLLENVHDPRSGSRVLRIVLAQ